MAEGPEEEMVPISADEELAVEALLSFTTIVAPPPRRSVRLAVKRVLRAAAANYL